MRRSRNPLRGRRAPYLRSPRNFLLVSPRARPVLFTDTEDARRQKSIFFWSFLTRFFFFFPTSKTSYIFGRAAFPLKEVTYILTSAGGLILMLREVQNRERTTSLTLASGVGKAKSPSLPPPHSPNTRWKHSGGTQNPKPELLLSGQRSAALSSPLLPPRAAARGPSGVPRPRLRATKGCGDGGGGGRTGPMGRMSSCCRGIGWHLSCHPLKNTAPGAMGAALAAGCEP